jgi:hypothetical protein
MNRISAIKNDAQDKNSIAWEKLCSYVDRVESEGRDEFSPLEELGPELYSQIYTLPETISKLKNVKKVWLYGSKLQRIPPEIGEMESLEYFDPYTSYDLHWFPFEIINCKNLKDSRVSTRALYGNYKNRMGFPDLTHPVRYEGDTVKCSICKKEMPWQETNQLWVSLWIGTDVLPLLANLCSKECEKAIPAPPENYVPHPHKGGSQLKQPPDENELFEQEMKQWEKEEKEQQLLSKKENNEPPAKSIGLLKLIKKIWEE